MQITTIKIPSAYGNHETLLEVKAVISKEVATVYYYEGKEFVGVPILKDGSFSIEEAFTPDEDLMRCEEYEDGKTYADLYKEIKKRLEK